MSQIFKKMEDFYPIILMIRLNVNVLNSSTRITKIKKSNALVIGAAL